MDSRPHTAPDGDASSSRFDYIAGLIALLGCIAGLLGNIIVVIINDKVGFVASTISDVAAGRYSWIQDIGFYIFAIGVLSMSVAIDRWRLDTTRWRAGTICLALVGVLVLIIGVRDEYGDLDREPFVIHLWLVSALAALFAAAVLLTARGFERVQTGWFRFAVVLALVWIVAGPLLRVVPTGWDGLYERILAVIMFLWVILVARLLIQRGRGARGRF